MSRMGQVELRERAALAREMLRECHLCPRNCGVNRLAGETGFCGVDGRACWFRENLSLIQELEIIPAHTIHLSGCSMRCRFCLVGDYVCNPQLGTPWDVQELRTLVEKRRHEGARTLLFMGGEATIQIHAVFDLLAELPERYTVVWDSNMLLAPSSRRLLEGVVDVYAGDLKFGNNTCAKELAEIEGYLEILAENLQFAEATASLIVRHLLLPGHFECCVLPMLEWLKQTLRHPRLSIRREYLPPLHLKMGDPLGRYVSESEHTQAIQAARHMGIEVLE